MASTYTNLRTERQYQASTGLSEQTFNQLFEQFKRFYVPKKGNSASPYEPLFQDAREALFFILFYFITLLQNLSDLTDTRLAVWVFR